MIEKEKQYRTRDGREVRIYATDHGPDSHIAGAVKNEDGQWWSKNWLSNGQYISAFETDVDLIEVKPRIKREYWVNIGKGGLIQSWHQEKDVLEEFRVPTTTACVKFTIDCEEGEGL